MKNYKLLSIDSGFDDKYALLSYRQELQNLYLLLDKHNKEGFNLDELKVNEPNLDLIKNLVNSLDCLNELEFLIALKQIERLKKPYPININFTSDLSSHYKKYACLINIFKNTCHFGNILNLLETHIDDDSIEFISYTNALFKILKYHRNNLNNFWEYIKHYRQGKYIINIDKPFAYLNWHLEQDLFNEIKEKDRAERVINAEIYNLETAEKLATFEIIIQLVKAKDKYTKETYGVGFKPAQIGYRYIKEEWYKEYNKSLIEDFNTYSKINTPKELYKRISSLLEEDSHKFEDIIDFHKYLIYLHNINYSKKLYKHKCKFKENSHLKTCVKEFLSHDTKALFCYECSQKPNLNAQRTRIHRENKAKL